MGRGFTTGWALDKLRDGYKVNRLSWEESGEYRYLTIFHYTRISHRYNSDPVEEEYPIVMVCFPDEDGDDAYCQWSPNAEDLMAHDWMIYDLGKGDAEDGNFMERDNH